MLPPPPCLRVSVVDFDFFYCPAGATSFRCASALRAMSPIFSFERTASISFSARLPHYRVRGFSPRTHTCCHLMPSSIPPNTLLLVSEEALLTRFF